MRLFWLEGTLGGVECDLLLKTELTLSSDGVAQGFVQLGFDNPQSQRQGVCLCLGNLLKGIGRLLLGPPGVSSRLSESSCLRLTSSGTGCSR